MTNQDKVEIYERFLHQMNMHISITLNQEKVNEGLKIIDSWSYAHRVGNGELSDEEQEKLVESKLQLMKDFI